MSKKNIRAQRIANAWASYYSVSDSKSCRCSNMICSKCGIEINGLYLIEDKVNHMLRGNEHDERYIFHRECSQSNIEWGLFDIEQKKYLESEKLREKNIAEVKMLIEKYNLDVDDLFENHY